MMKYHLTLIIMATVKKKRIQEQKITSIGQDVEKLEFLGTVGGNENSVAAMKNTVAVP
jgi:hypothetical protein